MSARMTLRKTIRLLGVSLALFVLLVFATGVVSDWHHQGPNDDAHCPYCHLGHQTPAQLAVAPSVSMLKPVASLPLPQDPLLATGPVFSETSPRAPHVHRDFGVFRPSASRCAGGPSSRAAKSAGSRHAGPGDRHGAQAQPFL